ncbi:MAG TPA: hypothetical protein VN638_07720, partial [Nitrospiraceae bacterium]|nr:hypothetical protein [Nitrospiraceae bacterium]
GYTLFGKCSDLGTVLVFRVRQVSVGATRYLSLRVNADGSIGAKPCRWLLCHRSPHTMLVYRTAVAGTAPGSCFPA